MNPFVDALKFLARGEWPIYLFWLLLLGGGLAAIWNLSIDTKQRTVKDIWMCCARILLGSMWWQQSLWKLPPYYTDLPSVPDSGLKHWMVEMVNNAAFSFQSTLVKDVILAHYNIFAPIVYGTEVLIAISLILGILTRLGATLGALMAINLWLGLYRSPAEWPWTYFFLVLLQITFAVLQAGRNLGIDALIVRRQSLVPETGNRISRLLALLT
jgi:uncharacterized membrane protein YphA (DoxX/SURF4 family)